MSALPDPKALETAVSPSLFRNEREYSAFEIKFLVTDEQAHGIAERLRPHMAPDPHSNPDTGEGYLVTTSYFETQLFDVFEKKLGYRRRKYRVRRYGESDSAYLERKSKSQYRVRKRRTQVPIAEASAVLVPSTDDQWPGTWFSRQIAQKQLTPICRVTYERIAFVGMTPAGPIRATFDRNIRGVAATDLGLTPVRIGDCFLPGQVIAEFKFMLAMSGLFKDIVADFGLHMSTESKYRRCAVATGLVPGKVV